MRGLFFCFFTFFVSGWLDAELVVRGIVQPAREAALSFVQSEVVTELMREGERVSVGQVVAHQDDRQLQMSLYQAEMQTEQARVAFDTAQHELQKKERLFRQNIVAPIAVEEAKFRSREAEARFKAAEAHQRIMELQVGGAILKAPFEGVIKKVYASVGERFGQGEVVLEVIDIDTLEVRVDLSLEQTESLKLGMQHDLFIGKRKVGVAKLFALHPFLDPASGTRRVVWRILPSSSSLLTGHYVLLSIPEVQQ